MSEALIMRYPGIFSILIEGPGWNDTAQFYGKWLLAAAEAERLWKEAVAADPTFREMVACLEPVCCLQFGTDAFKIIGKLAENVRTVVVCADSDLGDTIAMMALMRFFVSTGERYQMVLPPSLNSETVKAAGLDLAETLDADGEIHPEYLVTALPAAKAQAWQVRLQRMDEGQRLADRKLLLWDD